MRHTPKLVTLALLLMAAVGPGAAAEEPTPPVDEATALHMNAAHSGAVDGSGQTPPLVQRWDRDLGDLLSYPVVTGGRVFVVVRGIDGGYGTTLHGLDAQTGEDLWEPIAISGSWYWSGITAGDGRIYVLSGDGRLTAFDQATGALVWTVKHANMFASSEPTFYDGVVYAGGSGVGGVLYAADASDGHLLWSASLMNSDHSSPAVTEDAVFTGSTCEDIRAFDRLTGMKLWQHPSSCTGGGGRTVAVADGKVWARQPFGSNLVLDVATGAEVGTFASGPLPAFHDGRGFFLEGSTLRARSTSTLVAQWSFPSLDSLVSAPIVVNGNVYIGTQSGKLHVLDEATGELMWTTDVGSPIRPPDEHNVSEPVTGLGAGEGLIVVPATDRLVAYESLHSRLEPLTPARILDTRPTGPQRGYTGAKPAAGATLLVDVLGQGGVPETH
ncbi:MAG: PQQ-binding-like beta-propeller repeat protein, partial [Acidimicrobiales bacterium]